MNALIDGGFGINRDEFTHTDSKINHLLKCARIANVAVFARYAFILPCDLANILAFDIVSGKIT